MNLDELKQSDQILLECITGSRAYGLAQPHSDTDIKGIFYGSREQFYGLETIKQINNPTNDVVFYELGRFVELLQVNNPHMLELLATPADCLISRHPLLELVRGEDFLSKLCLQTFGRFALSQIRKARGLNKKILNPMGRERKTVLDFCYVNHEKGSLPLRSFLKRHGWEQEDCGLINIPHMKHLFGLYHEEGGAYHGIVRGPQSNEVALSSIPKEAGQVGLLYFNQDGYSHYCKEHKAYWDWVEKRNEHRYEQTLEHGKNYDAKNMMHTFRLLQMAIEIGETGTIQVRRPDREWLLDIRSGRYEYDELVAMAEEKQAEMARVYEKADLPEQPDTKKANQLLVDLRSQLYSQ